MISILILLIINSLVCLGFYHATIYQRSDKVWHPEEGAYITYEEIKGLLWWIPQIFSWLPEWLKKPLWMCLPCMASVHSFYVYWLYMGLNTQTILFYPIYILALSGINILVLGIYERE